MTTVRTLDDWAAGRMGLAAPLTRESIDAYQLARIRETVARVRATSPFYRSRADWPDHALESLADVARLPFTTPADLVRNDPPLSAISQSETARIVTLGSSGTTGVPKRVFFGADDIEATIDYFHHGMSLFAGPGDRMALAFPGDRPGGINQALTEAARRLGATSFYVPPNLSAEAFAAMLRSEQASVVFGMPVRILAACRVSAVDGGPPIAMRSVLLGGDNIPASLVRALKSIWGPSPTTLCEVFSQWGMTETGFGGAIECAFNVGHHLRETDLYAEVVDPVSGAPLRPGMTGELVVTTLRQQGLPLIRYRTGDLARLVVEPCACGSVLHRVDGFAGRIGAGVPLPTGGELTMGRLDEALFAIEAVTDFTADLDTCVLGRAPAPIDPLTLTLSIATPAPVRSEAVIDAVRAGLLAEPVIGSAIASGSLWFAVELADAALCRHEAKRRLHIEGVQACAPFC